MAERTVQHFLQPIVVTVPAGTTKAAPQSTLTAVGHFILESAELIIPTGHAGLTGVQLWFQGIPLVPWNDSTQWVIADGYQRTYPIDLEVDGNLQIKAFNTDQYAHSFYWYLLKAVFTGPTPTNGPQVGPVTSTPDTSPTLPPITLPPGGTTPVPIPVPTPTPTPTPTPVPAGAGAVLLARRP